MFGDLAPAVEAAGTVEALHAKIGQIAMEMFFGRVHSTRWDCGAQSNDQLRTPIAVWPDNAKYSIWCARRPILATCPGFQADLGLTRGIDEMHLRSPLLGAWRRANDGGPSLPYLAVDSGQVANFARSFLVRRI